MACSNKITANVIFNCDDIPVRGLAGGTAVLINYDDIDRAASTSTGSIVTNLALTSGSAGVEVQWYKELASTATSFVKSDEDFDGFSHQFLARLYTSDSTNAERAKELKNGKFVVVVKTAYGGTNDVDKFKVYGWTQGMELSEMAGNSNDNGSSLLFTLSTKEGAFEQYPYNIFLETDYTSSNASFVSLFA